MLTESEKMSPVAWTTETNERIMKCHAFVFEFNWRACIRVESELFFPWLQEMLPPSASYHIKNVYEKHERIRVLSKSLKQRCIETATNPSSCRAALALVKDLRECAVAIQNTQESLFVPYIAAYVSKQEQEKFNSKVIKRLGLLESQVGSESSDLK